MRSVYIDLKNGRLVKPFVDDIRNLKGTFNLVSGRTVINAKSLMGIYCLDLSKPILLQIDEGVEEDIAFLHPYLAHY
jgi:phosphotransferase system HPr-like phosphotransfer protein